MTLGYQKPPTWEAGQIAGRSNIGVLTDNDHYFNGLADRQSPVMYSPEMTGQAGQTNSTLWDGYHYYRAGASVLHYRFRVTAGASAACSVSLRYVDDDGNDCVIDSLTSIPAGTTQDTGHLTFNLASDPPTGTTISAGIHRVYLYMNHGAGTFEQGTARLWAKPWNWSPSGKMAGKCLSNSRCRRSSAMANGMPWELSGT